MASEGMPFGYGMDGDTNETNLYEILGIERNASKAEIKKAYHKAALSSHPDKVPETEREEAEIRFKAVGQAYDILYDDEKRSLYDTHGMAAFEKGGGADGPGGVDVDDIISQMFGMGGMGGMPGMNGRPKRPARGEDETQAYEITLEELYKGKTTRFTSEKKVICAHCKGRGGKESAKPKKCDQCKGNGVIRKMRMVGPGVVSPTTELCNICNGSGEFFKDKDRCRKCKGARTTKQKKMLELYIPAGSRDGEKIKIVGEADQEPGQEPGDIVFVLSEKQHEKFERAGNDLSADLDITLAEALTGFDRVVLKHLDGRGVQVKIDPSTLILKPDQVLRIRGEGMPKKRSDQKGDLYLLVKIKFPESGTLGDGSLKKLRDVLPKPGPLISADEVDTAEFDAEADIADMGAGSGDPRAGDAGWEDEDDDIPQGAQCAQQ